MPSSVSPQHKHNRNRYIRGYNPRVDLATVDGFVPRPHRIRFKQARFNLYLLNSVEDKQRGYLLRGWKQPDEAVLLVFN